MKFILREYPDLAPPRIQREGKGFSIIRTNPTYAAKWQQGAFFFQEVCDEPIRILDGDKLMEVDTSYSCGYYYHALSGTNICWFSRPKDHLTYYFGPLQSRTNGIWVHDNILRKAALFDNALHFGVSGLATGTVTWSNHHFSAMHMLYGPTVGTLHLDPVSSRPAALEYHTIRDSNARWRVEYGYTSNSILPTRFTRARLSSNRQPITEADVTVLTSTRYPTAFGFESYQKDLDQLTNAPRIYTVTEKGQFYFTGRKVVKFGSPPAVRWTPSRWAVVAGLAAFLFLWTFTILRYGYLRRLQ
jgi:hypothetical protein